MILTYRFNAEPCATLEAVGGKKLPTFSGCCSLLVQAQQMCLLALAVVKNYYSHDAWRPAADPSMNDRGR